MAQLMPMSLTVSCFSEIQIGFTFLVPAHPGSPGKRAVKRVCVCVWMGWGLGRDLAHRQKKMKLILFLKSAGVAAAWYWKILQATRVRSVEGSCAKHFTIEFYMVIMLLTFMLIIVSIPSAPHSFIPGLKPSFPANPSHRSLSFFLHNWLCRFPGLFTDTSEHSIF